MTRKKKDNALKAVSIEDVARAAGVSPATVSRVVNKLPSVKAKNRLKVLEVVKQMHYQPSIIAQRLATGKSNTVALVIPRYEGMFYSFYALELIRGIGTLCEVLKLDLLLHLSDANSVLGLNGVGGVIFADIIANRNQLEDAYANKIPCVVINNYVSDLDVNCIVIDNQGGAEQAVNYLISLEHKKIGHITGDLITQAAAQRLEGYKQALEKHNIALRPDYIIRTDYSRGQARQAAEKMLKLPDPPTAIFVASDSMALEVMAVAKELGKQIPRDISIVGFDDNPSGLYGPVSLTTVRQPLVKMAQMSVEELHRVMNQEKPSKVRRIALPAELIIRESCRALSSS
ncbi:MAG: LacI family transcriptional regulator [Candidatus Omnitrophica bacterium]|jgi:DNA-binding LacI/PurR family transcriptional regulator|nr:LacI family transcriptional regulator [Candidatus Omnitrophota bacterium]